MPVALMKKFQPAMYLAYLKDNEPTNPEIQMLTTILSRKADFGCHDPVPKDKFIPNYERFLASFVEEDKESSVEEEKATSVSPPTSPPISPDFDAPMPELGLPGNINWAEESDAMAHLVITHSTLHHNTC